MSPSRPFILRPVATCLLMAAILLVGIVAYTQLPVSALPEVDYPTIQVLTFYPGASPDVVATTVTAPLERQLGQLQGLSQMTSTSSGRNIGRCAAVQPEPEHRYRRRRGAVGDQRVAELSSGQPASASGVQQDEPGGCAGADAGDHVEEHTAADCGRPRRHTGRAEDLADSVCRARQHQRRPEARGTDSGESDGAVVLWHRPRKPAYGAYPEQRECSEGQLRRAATGLPDRRQRPTGHQ